MEKQHALKILNSLANGVHPATGEVFASDSPYQHPDTVRALFEAIRSIGDAAAPAEQKKPSSTFIRWTQEEEERLIAGFDAGKSTPELARLHDRSRAAIEARLLKLGKIDVSALTVQLRYGASKATP
jgi:molybdopterin-guanine dinucleotide biosynthesis protein A